MLNPISMHRLLFDWQADRRIEIECVKGAGSATLEQSPQSNAAFSRAMELDKYALSGVPAMTWSADPEGYFEPFQLREQTSYFIDVTLPRQAFDAAGDQTEAETWPFSPALSLVFRREPRRRWRVGDETVTIGGELRLLSHAGVLDLTTEFTGTLRAEVVPRKIRYRTELRALLNDLAKELTELMLRVESPVTLGLSTNAATDATAASLHFQLRHLLAPENLPAAVDEILGRFHTQLTTTRALQPLAASADIDSTAEIDVIDSTWVRQGPLGRLFRGHTPLELSTAQTIDKVDVPENRFAKAMLEDLFELTTGLEVILREQKRIQAADEALRWQASLTEMLSDALWRDVRPLRQMPYNSTVLQRRAGYRDLLRYSLALRLGLTLSWEASDALLDGLRGDVRPLSELYEYWCYFALARAVAQVAPSEKSGSGLFEAANGGLEVRLKRGRRSKRTFVLPGGAGEIDLFYNRKFNRPSKSLGSWAGSYTASFDPDYSLHIRGDLYPEGGHWIHFDAKYRIEHSPFSPSDDADPAAPEEADDADIYLNELARLYQQADLYKMHTYRDGILGSRGAYILYPGGGTATNRLFVRHPDGADEPQFTFPGVGAFSFTPGGSEKQIEVVTTFLRHFLAAAAAGDAYVEETGFFRDSSVSQPE